MVRACQVLDWKSAKDAGVDFLGGFGALVEEGIRPASAILSMLPGALATTDRICSSINVASARSGINMDAVALSASASLMSPATATVTASAAKRWWCSPTFRRTCPSWRARTSAWASQDGDQRGRFRPGVVKAIDRAMESHKPGEFTLRRSGRSHQTHSL